MSILTQRSDLVQPRLSLRDRARVARDAEVAAERENRVRALLAQVDLILGESRSVGEVEWVVADGGALPVLSIEALHFTVVWGDDGDGWRLELLRRCGHCRQPYRLRVATLASLAEILDGENLCATCVERRAQEW